MSDKVIITPKRNTSITAEEFLYVALLTPLGDPDLMPSHPSMIWGIPVNFIGLSGVSKTKKIRSVVKAIGLDTHYVYAGPKQPEDFAGAYVPTADGLAIECVLPAARRCINAGTGVIVLDEVNAATPRTQMAMLSFVDERQIGDHLLPPKVRFVLCMNPTEYAVGGHVLEGPFSNRMAHKDFVRPTNDQWGAWLTGTAPVLPSIKASEELIITRWFDHWPQVVGLASGFARVSKAEVLHKQPEPSSPESSGPWPSLRTWYMGIRMMCTARCLIDILITRAPASPSGVKRTPDEELKALAQARQSKLEEFDFEILQCLVGPSGGVLWETWVHDADLPAPHDMLVKGWIPDAQRLDRTFTCLTTMTEYLKTRPRVEAIPLAANGWRIIQACMRAGLSDLTIRPVQALVHASLGRGPGVTKETQDVSDQVMFDLSNMGFSDYVT